MNICSIIVGIGLTFLLIGPLEAGTDLVKETEISTTPSNAAVFRLERGKRQFLGYTPLSVKLEFPTENHTHNILLVKIGFEQERTTIRSDTARTSISLKKRELFAASTAANEVVHGKVKQQLQEDIYRSDRFVSRHNVTGQIHILPAGHSYSVGMEVLLFEDEMLKKIRKHARSGQSRAKQLLLIHDVFDHTKDLLQEVARSLKAVKAVRYIELTINYPVQQAELKFSREEMPYYYSSSQTYYHPDKTVTVTISGFTYNVIDTTDVYWKERTDSIKLIVPVEKVLGQGAVDLDAIKDDIRVLLRERKNKQFVKIDLSGE